jgi:hypothetical protein
MEGPSKWWHLILMREKDGGPIQGALKGPLPARQVPAVFTPLTGVLPVLHHSTEPTTSMLKFPHQGPR